MADEIQNLVKKASEIVNSFPKTTKIRVVSHYDADGISSAAIISKALYRAGYNFHTSLMRNPFDKGLKRVSMENNELIIFADMGSGQIENIEKLNCQSIILDHHQFLKEKTKDNVLQINSNLCGINGNYEACGSTLAYCFAKALDEENIDLGDLAITGATGDKQYIGGFRGFNKTLLEEIVKNGYLKERSTIKLAGETIYDSLFFSIDPYYSGISGNNDNIIELLNRLEIDKKVTFENISEKKKKDLQSFLMLKLVMKGCENNIIETVIRPRYFSDRFKCELERLADLVDSCGKGGNRGLGLELCLGDKDAFDKAIELEKQYKKKILDELISLENEGFKEKKSFRYFYSKNSSLGGVIGGIAINYILDNKKPLISIVKKDNEIHISCRGNQYLVKKGLDLGYAMKEAAIKLDGHGGGHRIAAGATISSDKEDEFLDFVDKIIKKQIM